MKKNKNIYKLYVITDRYWLKGSTLEEDTEKALRGGATLIQIREKNISDDEYVQRAKEIRSVTQRYNIPLIVNDNIGVALKSGADGVHLGQDDLIDIDFRSLVGENFIIGISVHNIEEARSAVAKGADYLGVGAVFKTSTKSDADIVSLKMLKDICEAVSIPVVAIGGITCENISELKNSGVSGVSVISAVYGQKNIEQATKALKAEVDKLLSRTGRLK